MCKKVLKFDFKLMQNVENVVLISEEQSCSEGCGIESLQLLNI